MQLAVKRVAAAQVDVVVVVAFALGRHRVAREAAPSGTDRGTGEAGHHGAAEHAPARNRCAFVGFGRVVRHGQPADTTFCATIDRLWCSGWMTAVSFGASVAFSAGVYVRNPPSADGSRYPSNVARTVWNC